MTKLSFWLLLFGGLDNMTVAELENDLIPYRAARDKILAGQSVTIGDMQLRRPDLAMIEGRIKELEFRIARLSAPTHSSVVFRGGA